MKYMKIAFSEGPVAEGYQEIDDTVQTMTRLTDLHGNTIDQTQPLQYTISDEDPPHPPWAV